VSARRLPIADTPRVPAYVVWELTLRCDQRCTFCGSRADDPRDAELTTDEALGVADQLAKAGAREVVLIGGEAYLHDGVYAIIARLRERGVVPVMTRSRRSATCAAPASRSARTPT
jgi:MoaA/NifB/PqqE/SkfB family radical SAM enzyme